MKFGKALAAIAAVVGLFAAQGASAQTPIDGIWRNPKNSVHVQIASCGPGACGHVVWASAKAQKDAREGGTADLIGLQLFRDFVRQNSGLWKGRVFVPDLNATFSGSAEQVDEHTLRAKGCLIGGFLCKTQVWTRIDE